MSDIALKWNDNLGAADFAITANDLLTDDGLETAVLLSLFTDRRAAASDPLQAGATDRRGWWGDAFPDVDGDQLGSRLWELARATPAEWLTRAPDLAREALAWLTEDQISDYVDVAAGVLQNRIRTLAVTIRRPGGGSVTFRYQYAWDAQARKV